jgi:RimJ/RimL family protein N-acetyltransferase
MPPANDYFLTSRRLGFRTWREADLDLARGLWGDLRVTRLFDARGAFSRQQVEDRLRREITTQRDHQVQYWPIFELATGAHVGCAGLRPYDLPGMIFEIGFHIRPEHWRQGFALEAARAVMAYAFERMVIKALFAGHHPDNTASRRLLAKLGFAYTHDEYYPPTGRHHPSYLLSAVDQAHRVGGR